MSEEERDFTEAIERTREEVPDWSDNRGFWSGGASTIEYKPNIDTKKIKQTFGSHNISQNDDFELACTVRTRYMLGFTKRNLYLRTWTSDDNPAFVGNVEAFYVGDVSDFPSLWSVYCIPLIQILNAKIIPPYRKEQTWYILKITLSSRKPIELETQCYDDEHVKLVTTLNKHCRPLVVENLVIIAKEHEKLLEFDEASSIYKDLDMDKEVIRVREEQRNKVNIDQNVVHGDQITKTEIKDSVINKSNIGSGGDDKFTKLKELKEMLSEGLIDNDEFKQMKKEILGK